MLLFELRQTADARTEANTTSLGWFTRKVEPAVCNRPSGGDQRKLSKTIQPTGITDAQDVGGLETLDFATEVDTKGGGIEPLDRADATVAGQQFGPKHGNGVGQGGDKPGTRDGNSALVHGEGWPRTAADCKSSIYNFIGRTGWQPYTRFSASRSSLSQRFCTTCMAPSAIGG